MFIDDWWKSFEVRGASSFVAAEKLKALKLKIKCWNKEVFRRVEERKNQALHNLAHWDSIGAQRPLSQFELERKVVEVEEFKKWALLEEIKWRQKSREFKLKEGDKNTRFFHKMTNSHIKHNDITRLKINEVWFMEGHDLKQDIVDAFQTLLSDLRDWRANLEGLIFSKLDEHEAVNLEMPFTEVEVIFALRELNREKAPSPDGYTIAF